MQVEAYLEAFADAFHLHEYIRYETRVVSLKLLGLPSTNGHASSDGAQISSGVDNGVQHSPTNGSGLAHSDVVAAPPRWCISTEPAEKSVSQTSSYQDLSGPHAACTLCMTCTMSNSHHDAASSTQSIHSAAMMLVLKLAALFLFYPHFDIAC